MEPAALGLFRSQELKEIPWFFTNESREEKDDLLVIAFFPPPLANLAMRSRETVSFRPSLDFRIVACTMESGGDTWQREEFEYAPWDGRQFIKEYRRTGRGPDGQPMEEVLSVQKVVFSESLPAEVFRTELASGTFVQDEIMHRCIKLDTGSGTGSRAMSVQEIREQTRREKAAGAIP